jgi:hypothetical protein
MHLLLAERGAAILPEAGNQDGRVSLTDAMLAVAALAPSFALARVSLGLGVASLVVVVPALARTHVVMVRARVLGSSPNAAEWLFAFVSATLRIGLILFLVAVIHAASLAVGWSLGARLTPAPLPARAWIPAVFPPTPLSLFSPTTGAVFGFLLIGVPLTLLALTYLVPRLLTVRDPV